MYILNLLVHSLCEHFVELAHKFKPVVPGNGGPSRQHMGQIFMTCQMDLFNRFVSARWRSVFFVRCVAQQKWPDHGHEHVHGVANLARNSEE